MIPTLGDKETRSGLPKVTQAVAGTHVISLMVHDHTASVTSLSGTVRK